MADILHDETPGGTQLRAITPPTPPREMRIQVTPVNGKVQIDFGRAVWWLQVTPENARKMADDLLSAAQRAGRIILAGEG